MTSENDLVSRLKHRAFTYSWDSGTYYASDADMMRQAADRIEALQKRVAALTAERDRLRDRVAELESLLRIEREHRSDAAPF